MDSKETKKGAVEPRAAKKIKKTESAASAAPPRADTTKKTEPTASAAPPRAATTNSIPLSFLNTTTAKLATFEVCMTNGHYEEYSYKWDGQDRKTKVFRNILVSVDDNSQYCIGEVRKEKGRPADVVESAMETYKDGCKFRLSMVDIKIKDKPQYNHASHKIIVDLHNTKATKLLHDATVHAPMPSITCAECVGFNQYQAFDITALISNVSDPRSVQGRRHVRELTLLDGSTDASTDSVTPPIICPKVSVFYDKNMQGEDPAFMQAIVENVGKPTPFHFYGLTAQSTNNGMKIATSIPWYKIMVANGPRADKLIAEHTTTLAAYQNTNVRTLEHTWTPEDRDGAGDESLNDQEGQDTFCALLNDMSTPTGIASLDDKPSVWQLNWAFATIVPGNILTSKGDKIWLKIMLRDISGSVEVRMNEKHALELSGCKDKDHFIQSFNDGDPLFPSVLSIKVARKVKVLQPGDEEPLTQTGDVEPLTQTFVNYTVLAVSAQNVGLPRTEPSKELIGIMKSFSALSSAILPASPLMMMPPKVYPLMVQYPMDDLRPQPCQKVWMLLKATRKSTCTDEEPYLVTTEEVENAIGLDEDTSTAQKFQLMSMCNKDNRSSLMLTPSHGKHVFALAVITAMKDNTLFAESVETIQQSDKDSLAMTMRQEITLAVSLMKHAATGNVTTWTDTMSPLGSKRCRELSKSPTGPELEAFEAQPTKVPRTS